MGKVYVWCSQCAHEWHVFAAIAEDGEYLAGHLCSHHGWAAHDMGITPDGWKREEYAKKYPDGFEVVLVERPDEHLEFQAAFARNQARKPADADRAIASCADSEAGA